MYRNPSDIPSCGWWLIMRLELPVLLLLSCFDRFGLDTEAAILFRCSELSIEFRFAMEERSAEFRLLPTGSGVKDRVYRSSRESLPAFGSSVKRLAFRLICELMFLAPQMRPSIMFLLGCLLWEWSKSSNSIQFAARIRVNFGSVCMYSIT